MNKFIYSCLFLLLAIPTFAQQHRYAVKIGLHAGLSNYYGDLNHQVWDLPHQFKQPIQDFNFLSYGLSVEYHLSKTFGLRLWGMKSQFKASDRTYENSGTYTRALNVQTDLFDASLLGIVYLDNDLVFNSNSIIAPYFMLGGGMTYFETKGDLLSNNNNRYYYWSDNTIRTEDQNGINAANAQIIEQDYQYETSLRPLNTEENAYSPITWNVALGLGIKFRLSKRFNLHLEALVRYTGSDYLDDVSGNYRTTYNDNFQAYAANPSGINRSRRGNSPEMNDWYSFVGLSAHYSFGQKTYKIRPAIIYTEGLLTTMPPVSNTTGNTTKEWSSSTGQSADTIVQKIITTTTTIKTVTSDTINSTSLSSEENTNLPSSNVAPIRPDEISKPTVNRILDDSIRSIAPPVVPQNYTLDSTRLELDSIEQTRLPQRNVDSLLNDSIPNIVLPPVTNYQVDSTYISTDSLTQNRISTPTINTIINDSIKKLPAATPLSPSSDNSETIRTLELQQQEQKYQYELLLQKAKYERQLAELALQKELEQERKKSAPNSKEQELQYQLKLEEQKHINELEKLKLLHQLELLKNRPSLDTTPKELQLQQQKYEADLKLQQQEYEYKLKIQELQNQLNIEQLKKTDGRTGAVNPSNSSTLSAQELERLTSALNRQSGAKDTLVINNNYSPAAQEELMRMQANQRALLLQIERLKATQPASKDTLKIVQRDSIFIDNGNNAALTKQLNQQQDFNNSLVAKLAIATQKSVEQQRKIDSLQRTIQKVESEKKSVASELEVFLAQKKGTYVTKIYFDVGKSSLTVQAQETLTTLVHYLEKYPTVQFWVKGFASKTGRKELNERLSAERAQEVANFLKQSGIQGERVRSTPLGELDSSARDELARRAEVHLSF